MYFLLLYSKRERVKKGRDRERRITFSCKVANSNSYYFALNKIRFFIFPNYVFYQGVVKLEANN